MVLPSGPAGKAEGQSRKTARPGEERSAAGKALTLSYREPACVRCGACMTVCPLYRLVGRETSVARGKLNLLNAWQEGRFSSDGRLREVLACCLLCGACTEQCAVGLQIPKIIKEARGLLQRNRGLRWHPDLLLARLTWEAPHLITVAASLAPVINRIKSWVGRDSGLVWRLFPHLVASLEGLPDLTSRPLRSRIPALLPGRERLKIAFFVGCGLEVLYPQVGEAFLAICQRLGLEVAIPPHQGCCGLMAESVGSGEVARRLAQRVVQDFAAVNADFVVTACASCAYQLKRLNRLLAGTPDEEAATRLSAKVREASEFLAQEVGYRPEPRTLDLPVAFHDPCHLHRGQGIVAEPRELLRAATGDGVVEPAEKVCCGQGGAFAVMYPELSWQLGRARSQDLTQAGAELVVTSCTGCLMQLARTGPQRPVRHLLEVIV